MVDLLVILVIVAAVVLFVSAPLRRAPDVAGPIDASGDESPGSELRELEAARDAKLRELRDAELDHRTGKLSDEDFAEVDGSLRQEAIEILRDLDEARAAAADGADPDTPAADPDTATISD
jgi:hypothetical protein